MVISIELPRKSRWCRATQRGNDTSNSGKAGRHTQTVVDGALGYRGSRHQRVRRMLYVQVSRLNEMFESFGADTSLQFGINVSLKRYLASSR